ncbi:MAG: hypothetical protein RL226_1542 [Bacteroidota bacterium]
MAAILRGLDAISFVTSARMETREIPLSSAAIPTMVIIQLANETLAKSVGENVDPFPLLSTGASVIMVVPDFT